MRVVYGVSKPTDRVESRAGDHPLIERDGGAKGDTLRAAARPGDGVSVRLVVATPRPVVDKLSDYENQINPAAV